MAHKGSNKSNNNKMAAACAPWFTRRKQQRRRTIKLLRQLENEIEGRRFKK